MKITLRNRIALIGLLFALTLPLASKVYASGPFATNYTNASLTGVYGYSLDGWGTTNRGGQLNTSLDVVGVMSFDGSGNFAFHDTANLGGSVSERGTADNPIVGTYSVNPDGTGTMQFVVAGTTHIRAFVIVAGGTELQFGDADSLSTNRGVAKKQ